MFIKQTVRPENDKAEKDGDESNRAELYEEAAVKAHKYCFRDFL